MRRLHLGIALAVLCESHSTAQDAGVADAGLVRAAASSGPVLFAGAGDIGWCTPDGSGAARRPAVLTARLLERAVLEAERHGHAAYTFGLGDFAYPDGSEAAFACFDNAWGKVTSRMVPTAGNHDEIPKAPFRAAPYVNYFLAKTGRIPGTLDPPRAPYFYSTDVGSWHVVVLDSNCYAHGSCAAGSVQHQWLVEDLRAHPAKCTVALWHHARYSSIGRTRRPIADDYGREMDDLFDALVDGGVELLLSGHHHDYERFAPTGKDDARHPRGVRQFVVGTGGGDFYAVPVKSAGPSERVILNTHGVLKLWLSPRSYTWEFEPTGTPSPETIDRGQGVCH